MVLLIDDGKILVKFLYKRYDSFGLCELRSCGVVLKPDGRVYVFVVSNNYKINISGQF
jgi:hypothetical protein